MAELITKVIVYLNEGGVDYKTERPKWSIDEFCVTDDGAGAFIENWNASKIGLAKPTDEQLNALDVKATTHQNNAKVNTTRRAAYGDIGDQLDLLYKDLVAGKVDATGEWAKAVKKVKDDNPKS